MADATSVTYLFTDIEGSTRLWESDVDRASRAIAWHDAISRDAVLSHHGRVVKMTGDGMHAAFDDPAAASSAAIALQLALASPPDGVHALKVRCGLHIGADQRRDNDYFGPAVNRAARIMAAAHGGQILLSKAVYDRIGGRLPAEVALRDLGDVRLKDLGSPERLYQVVHRSLPAEFPALRSLASVPNNLPQQLDRFIGREREIDEIRSLLRNARLVTLCAMGGVGKSRLSVQLGAEVLDDYRDGVWLVELAPLSVAAHIPQAIASVLGVKEEPGGGLVPALERFVRERSLLLILDNCEHLVQDVAELAKRLLQAAAGLKILATTRDPLHIAGERLIHLPTLNVPKEGERLDQLLGHAAVQLFVERAAAVQPAFGLTEKNAQPVSEICRRLDGIPLALELAAARVRSLPVEVLASRLDQRFRLLTTPDRTVLPRQRTLRALIDWSHDLLDERERAVFRRLAVFAGGWTLEAAEAVVAGDIVQADDVLDLVSSLVEKSLVAMEADTGRYRMLDTVAQYAEAKLLEADELATTRLRHCTHFVAMAESARSAPRGDERTRAFDQLDVERDNLLSALSIETSTAGDALALRLADALRHYLINRGLPSVALRSAEGLLNRPVLQGRTLQRCKTLFAAGQVAYFMGRHREATGHLTESLGIARDLNDNFWIAATLQPLGMACIGNGDYAAAGNYLGEALQCAERLDLKSELLAALNARAMLHRLVGETDDARRLYSRALAISRELEDHESAALLLLNLVIVSIGGGSLEDARAQLLDAIGDARMARSRPALQAVLDVAAGLAAAARQWPIAARFFGAAEAEAVETGLQRDPADQAFLAPLVASTRSAYGASFDAAYADGRSLSLEVAIGEVGRWLADASAPATVR